MRSAVEAATRLALKPITNTSASVNISESHAYTVAGKKIWQHRRQSKKIRDIHFEAENVSRNLYQIGG
jgi:hypothetical protein